MYRHRQRIHWQRTALELARCLERSICISTKWTSNVSNYLNKCYFHQYCGAIHTVQGGRCYRQLCPILPTHLYMLPASLPRCFVPPWGCRKRGQQRHRIMTPMCYKYPHDGICQSLEGRTIASVAILPLVVAASIYACGHSRGGRLTHAK
jgi:hypothetical protein